jgi:threonine dehydrogenase-like Zn-dependent dehydrogenase
MSEGSVIDAWPGENLRLGATWDGEGTNFARLVVVGAGPAGLAAAALQAMIPERCAPTHAAECRLAVACARR